MQRNNMPNLTPWPTGLIAITGGERTGKTSYLQQAHADARWLDLALPARDKQTAGQVWATMQATSPQWNAALHAELVDALKLTAHLDKQLFMLSAGSRRKVALAGLLACGATVTCLDQPYAALDMASIQVVRGFLHDMAAHSSRTWMVADYEADPQLPWRQVISLD